jgi:hypothetical protein
MQDRILSNAQQGQGIIDPCTANAGQQFESGDWPCIWEPTLTEMSVVGYSQLSIQQCRQQRSEFI